MQIIKYKKFYILFSLLLLVPGIISLAVFKLNLSIDFTGGSVFKYEIKTQDQNNKNIEDTLRVIFKNKDIVVESITYDQDNIIVLRTKPVVSQKNDEIKTELTTKLNYLSQVSFETVGPSVGKEAARKAFLSVIIASLGILLYIAYAFRNIPKPYSSFRFGVSAIVAMLHDAFVVLGIFSLLGHFLKVEIDALFITAILTVIGFSVHDTIVVFDRIRENLNKLPKGYKFSDIVNYSVVETLNRSMATSLTVITTLLSLFILGGSSIRYFVLALLIGITSGTYSSIFTAAPILVYWEELKLRKK